LRGVDAGLRVVAAGFAAGLDPATAGFAAADVRVDPAGFRAVDAGFDADAAGLGVPADALADGAFAAGAFAAGAFAAVAAFAAGFRFDAVAGRVVLFGRAVGLLRAVRLGTDAVTAAPAPVRAALALSGPPIGPTLTGDTASTAWAAAAPTSLAAPLTLPPTVPAALPAADAARPAILPAIVATSWAASPACFVRLATCFRPFEPCATASWARRFASIARAATRRFSSF
jgi:hypothetical protein